MSRGRLRLAIVVLSCFAFLSGIPSAGAAGAEVYSIVEGRDPTTERAVILVFGSGLTSFKTVVLKAMDSSLVPGIDILQKGKTLIVLGMPPQLAPGTYLVSLETKSGLEEDFPVSVTLGDIYHDHDPRYYTKAELSDPGSINSSLSPVDWTKLKNVPLGFADGTDDGGFQEVAGNAVRLMGNVGIGVFVPTASLHVAGNDGVLFGGALNVGTIPEEGAGVRMMWYPKKGAFRVGRVSGSQWDDVNVGAFSLSAGFNTSAENVCAVALGEDTRASGSDSLACGTQTEATGTASTAMGGGTTASGRYATSMGIDTTAQPYGSLVLGRRNVIEGDPFNYVATDPVLVVGNGTGVGSESNALTLLKNGDLTIAGTLTESSDARLKMQIAPLTRVLPRLAGIHGVTYRFKDEDTSPGGPQIGLLAQEVREAFPELVHEDSQGKLSVAYGKFTAVLLEAVKEQQAVIEDRDRKIEDLEKRLARLEGLAAK